MARQSLFCCERTRMMRPSAMLDTVYLCVEHVDFRKSINGLSAIVEENMELDPFQPALFVFINRGKDKLKILYWEKSGFCLWYKRLEKERFQWPKDSAEATITLNGEALNWLLDGFDIWRNKPHQTLHYPSAL